MADRTRFIYCEAREVKVDLDRGFHGCIQDNQCFSDEPWPLDGRFLEPRCKIKIRPIERRGTQDLPP